MFKENIFFWMCMAVAGLFVYGKYFTTTTELDKVYYSISAMLWVILGLGITILQRIFKLNKGGLNDTTIYKK